MTKGQEVCTAWGVDKGMTHIWLGRSRMVQDFIPLLRMACHLNLTDCVFLEFSLNVF